VEIQKLLPKTSFVPFMARRLINANVVYANLPLFHEYGYFKEFECENDDFYNRVLDYFAYIVPNGEEDNLLVNREEKKFLAERYGGAGILANGGGARCGLSGPFSLKGIGPAPLVGQGVNFWYSHGRMGLEDALSELFYSRLVDTALPMSSSRILAVIDTGGMILQRAYKKGINPEDDECNLVRAGIIVRETKIRPAHFGRAFYFKPSQYMKEHHIHDFHRVGNVIPFLPAAVGIVDKSLNEGEQFYRAIEHILSASAVQLAYSKVRRVMHGSLGFSNILVNGGWIDFGSATVVPSYGHLITAEMQPAYWDEVLLFRKTAADLCFYVRKFQPHTHDLLGNGMEMYQQFLESYIQHLRVLFIELTGVPLVFLREFINVDWYKKLGAILLHIARMEEPKAHASRWVLHAEQPSHSWSNGSLRAVLQVLFHHYWVAGKNIAPHLPFKQQMINDLWESYCSMCAAIEAKIVEQSIKRESLVRFIAFNMTRQLMGVTPFYRGHMLSTIAEQLSNSSSFMELRANIKALYINYDILGILYYKSPINTRLLIAINAHYMRLFWDLELNQYRMEVPTAAVIQYGISDFTGLSYQSEAGGFLSAFQLDDKESLLVTCFDPCHIGENQNFGALALSKDKKILLVELFPDFKHFYSNFVTAIRGEAILADLWDGDEGLV
jgi:hypothetical protein